MIIYGVDLCDKPLTDPCNPGGKWDPLLERFVNNDIGFENFSFIMLSSISDYTLQFSLQLHANQYTGAYIDYCKIAPPFCNEPELTGSLDADFTGL